MNEEEKQAIEFLKHSLYEYEEIDTSVMEYIDKNHKIIYKLILKQQKEIEELKEKNKILEELLQGRLFELYNYYKELAGKYQGNCISKDKIKEIIENHQKFLSNESSHYEEDDVENRKAIQYAYARLSFLLADIYKLGE